MRKEEKLISDCFTYDLYDYVNLEGENIKPYLDMVENWFEVKRILLGNPIRVNGKNYIPKRFDLQMLEVDAMIELLDGSMHFTGAVYLRGFDDPIALFIDTKNFKVYDVSGANMGGHEDLPEDFELLMIDNDKLIASVNTKSIPTGPNSTGTKYGKRYKGSI